MVIYICCECKKACVLATESRNIPEPEDCPWGNDWAKWKRIDEKEG